MIEELIKFVRLNHPTLAEMPYAALWKLFDTYKETTLVWQQGGEIKGFALYQDWDDPPLLNFIIICGNGTQAENLKALLRGSKFLTKKQIVWFDEKKKICHKLRV